MKSNSKQLKLFVPAQKTTISSFLTASGTFHDGDFLLNQKGLKQSRLQPSESKDLDFGIAAEDLETVKVIGKGSGGVVQLVRHKWVGKFFAMKKDPQARSSSLDLLSHPFIKKFEDKDIDLGILVGTLEPPVNYLR